MPLEDKFSSSFLECLKVRRVGCQKGPTWPSGSWHFKWLAASYQVSRKFPISENQKWLKHQCRIFLNRRSKWKEICSAEPWLSSFSSRKVAPVGLPWPWGFHRSFTSRSKLESGAAWLFRRPSNLKIGYSPHIEWLLTIPMTWPYVG